MFVIKSIIDNLVNLHWVTNPEWWSAIGTVGVTAIAIGISFWSVHIGKENKKNDSLRYVFQLLDDNGHRNARRRIINLDGEDLDYRKEKILRLLGLNDDEIKRKEAICKESQEIVKADFDQIGTLLKNKEIPKDEFIKIYWHDVLKCWQVLDNDIKGLRETLNDDTYMENFQYLEKIAREYAKKKKKLDLEDIKKLIQKDITVYPNLNFDKPYVKEVRVESDEYLKENTVNNNTIYLVDEDNNKIPSSSLTIEYDPRNRYIDLKNITNPSGRKGYVYLSTCIKDKFDKPLKKPKRSDFTF